MVHKKAGLPHQEKPATEVTDFSVNLVLNCSPSPPHQYARSKDQDTAEDREEPCAGAACAGKFVGFNRPVNNFSSTNCILFRCNPYIRISRRRIGICCILIIGNSRRFRSIIGVLTYIVTYLSTLRQIHNLESKGVV